MGGHFYGYEVETFLAVEGVVLDRSFALSDHSYYKYKPCLVNSKGVPYARTGIATILLKVPFYLLGLSLNLIFPSDPYYYIRPICVMNSSAVFTALICIVVFAFAQRLFGSRKVALILTFIYGFCTMAFPYSRIGMEPLLTLCAFTCLFSLYQYKHKRTRRWAVAAGIFAGLTTGTKLAGIVFLPIPFIYLLLSWFENKQRSWKQLALEICILFIPVAFFLVLIGWYNFVRFDTFYETGFPLAHHLKTIPIYIGVYGFLFGSGKSIFLYNLPTIFCFRSAKEFYKKHRSEAIIFLIICIVWLLFYSTRWTWSDETWGPRHMHLIIPCLVLSLGILVKNFHGLRRFTKLAFITVLLCGFSIQILAISFSYFSYVDVLAQAHLNSNQLFQFIPDLSPIRGHWLLFKSAIHKLFTGKSLIFRYTPLYIYGIMEGGMQEVEVDLSSYDNLDFWLLSLLSKAKGILLVIGFIIFIALAGYVIYLNGIKIANDTNPK